MTHFTPPPAPGEIEASIGQDINDIGVAFPGMLPLTDLGACAPVALAAQV